MKKFDFSIGWFSFLFSLSIVLLFSIISHFYIQESIQTIKAQEEQAITCYINKLTGKVKSIEDLRLLTFGTLESFEYQIAIIDNGNKLLYSTFAITPTYNLSKITYFQGDSVFYNATKYFDDVSEVKVIVQKKIDYSSIITKIIVIFLAALVFLVGCSLFLYFHIKNIYAHITTQLDAFFKDAIHEIRTPLGVVQINLDFLENNLESSMPLKRAQGGLRSLTSVYESLEYCIKNKKVKYKKETIDLSEFIKNRIDFFKVLAEIKEVKIESIIQKDITVFISRVELQRLIDNNLSNAIKYSKNQTLIHIELYLQNDFLYLKFSNYGEKIQDVNKIFQRYYRGDEIKGGFGLGLSIVEHICHIYNIHINVTSDAEGHTTFLYVIPQTILQRNS